MCYNPIRIGLRIFKRGECGSKEDSFTERKSGYDTWSIIQSDVKCEGRVQERTKRKRLGKSGEGFTSTRTSEQELEKRRKWRVSNGYSKRIGGLTD